MAVTADELRRMALGMPDAEERETWGHPTFRVDGAIFVGLAADGTTANVKTSPEEQQLLVGSDPDTYSVAPRTGRHGWTEIQLATANADQVHDLLRDAWHRTAPHRLHDDA